MTNLCIRWNTTSIITDGLKEVKIINVHFFTKTGGILDFPFSNILGVWIRLDGDYPIKIRRKVDTSRNEVFAVKSEKTKGHYDVYIPFEAAGGRVLDKETFNFGDYDYTYQPYLVSGYNLVKFSQDVKDVFQIEKNTLKAYSYVTHTPTEEHKKLNKLSYEIEKECGVSVENYILKSILKKYDIVKRKNSE